MFDSEGGSEAYLISQPVYIYILKRLPILIILHHGNLKGYLLKVLNHLKY